MPQITPTEQDQLTPAQDPVVAPQADSAAPVSYVPHDASGAIPHEPVKFRSSRYGELEEHELIRLLDTIEDERARGRFRESIYISCFIWLIIAWVGFYGPRYLWHAPKVINPMDVLKQREMTQLNFSPASPHISAPPRPAAPAPKMDEKMLERLRAMTKSTRVPENLPNAPEPAKVAPTPSNVAPEFRRRLRRLQIFGLRRPSLRTHQLRSLRHALTSIPGTRARVIRSRMPWTTLRTIEVAAGFRARMDLHAAR